MNKRIKNMLRVIGEHFLYIIVSLALVCIIGAAFQKAFWVVSIVTAVVYLSSIYSMGWNLSGKDMRAARSRLKQGEAEKLEYNVYDGFVDAIPLLVLSFIVYVCYVAFDGVFFVAFRVYNFAFVNLFDKFGKLRFIADILATVLPFVAYGVGYIVGKNKKTFLVQHIGKIVYKQKKPKGKQ